MKRLIFLILIIFAAKCQIVSFDEKVEVGNREFYINKPENFDTAENVPAIIYVHGYGSDAGNDAEVTNLANEASYKYLVATVESAEGDGSWNAGSCCE